MHVDLFSELQKFNEVVFHEQPHIYFIGKQKLESVTGILKNIKQPFDDDYWLVYSALKKSGWNINAKQKENKLIGFSDYNKFVHYTKIKEKAFKVITPSELKKDWDYKKNHACYEGSVVHNFIENFYANKRIQPQKISDDGIKFCEIKDTVSIMIKQFLKFHKMSKKHLIPIRSELVVGDKSINLGGMVDQLFYNKFHSELQIWDWKTNTKLKTSNKFAKLRGLFSHLDACEYNEYSIQLNCYKEIIQRKTNLKIGGCYIVHFNENNNSYTKYKCLDLNKEIKQLFSERSKQFA